MTEQALLKIIAGISTYTMALFGIDYYSLVYALLGAMLLLSSHKKTTKLRAVGFVLLSAVTGAAMGTALIEYVGTTSKSALFVAAMVCGGGALWLLKTMLDALTNRIKQAGGTIGGEK